MKVNNYIKLISIVLTFCGGTTVQASNAISKNKIMTQILNKDAKSQELRCKI